jgi:hypothetical protein
MSETQNTNNITSTYHTFINNYMSLCNEILTSMTFILQENSNITSQDNIRTYFENTSNILNTMNMIERNIRNHPVNIPTSVRENPIPHIQTPNISRQHVQPIVQPQAYTPITRERQRPVPRQLFTQTPINSNIVSPTTIPFHNIQNTIRPPGNLPNFNIIPFTYYTTTTPLNNTDNPLINNMIESLMGPLLNSFSEAVPIIPSESQIINSTTISLFRTNDISNNENEICPIDLSPFNEGDEIIRIKHCGHTFRYQNLRTWFNTSPTCPVCRYDIRNYIPIDDSNNTVPIIETTVNALNTVQGGIDSDNHVNRDSYNSSVMFDGDSVGDDDDSVGDDNDNDNDSDGDSHDYNMSYFEE